MERGLESAHFKATPLDGTVTLCARRLFSPHNGAVLRGAQQRADIKCAATHPL